MAASRHEPWASDVRRREGKSGSTRFVIGQRLVSSHSPNPPSPANLASLLGELSHELRTPLAVIRIQAQMLKRLIERHADDDPTVRERYVAGLERIDLAVTTLNTALVHWLDQPLLDTMDRDDGSSREEPTHPFGT